MSDPVLDLLIKNGIDYKISGRDYLVSCLNPEHPDSSPSMRIDMVTGIFNCFSCSFRGNLFKHYGVLTNSSSIKIARLKNKLHELKVSFNGVDFPHEMIPLNRPFRGISVKTLKEFGAFYTHGEEKLADRAFFPILDIRNKPVAYVGRHMLSNGNPRYLNYPRGVTLPVFPERLKVKSKSLVLVEGIFDMLNLYDKGLKNVSCIFGVNALDKDPAIKLLPFRTQGVTKIYLMFDGDEAGRKAMDRLLPLLEESDYMVERINLEDGSDPGELTQEEVTSINEWINKDA